MVTVQEQSTFQKQNISWENFQQEYLSKEDGYKYEWVDGYVEKTTYSMNTEQVYILKNLRLFFLKLNGKLPINGLLESGIETFFAGNHRRPDISFVTFNQIDEGRKGEKIVPKFIVDIISANDQINKVQKKMDDYDDAEVAVVWHIFPDFKKIHVYKGNQMTVCRGKDICSAEPVIEGFKMTVEEVFAD